MRFCHVTTFYPPYHFGGDAILAQAVVEGLARRGHQVTVVHSADAYFLRGAPVPPPPPDPPGVRRVTLRSPFRPVAPLVIQQTGRPGLLSGPLRRVLSQDYDVVHFHNISLVGGPGVLPLSRAPVTLYSPHDHWLFCTTHVLWKDGRQPCDQPRCLACALRSGTPPQLWRAGKHVARSLEHVDALLSPSAYTAERHRAAGVTRPIRVIASFTQIPVAPASDTRPGEFFLYAGRLVRSKGVEQLLEAFAQRPALPLRVVGDGPLGPALRARYGAAANITFLATQPHAAMGALYDRALAVVAPCWGPEVFLLTAIEAMARGAPVIVRRAGGSAEAVERVGGGLVYDHPDGLLPLVDRLAADPALRAALSARGRSGVAAHYSEDAWMRAYFGCIEDFAAGARGAR